jgi:hypothetical protein
MDSLEQKLKEKLGDGFEGALEKKIADFGGLLTRAAAVRLLCKQHGIEVERRLTLAEAASSPLPFSFAAKIDRIYPVQTFQNGTDRTVRVHLSDAGWSSTLVLWNEQADVVDGGISIGDEIEATGAYFRSGEIVLGRNGTIRRSRAFPITQVGKLTAGACNVQGEVEEVELDYPYIDKKSGQKKVLSSFQLCEGGECRRVAVWSAPEGMQMPQAGDVVLLENVVFRSGEVHFNSGSRIVKLGSSMESSGKIERLEAQGGTAVLEIGKDRFQLPLDLALSMLGIHRVPEGVSPATVLSIKAAEVAGKKVRYRKSGQGLEWLAFF